VDKVMAKMSDVAKLANVSTATVSRVLRKPDAVKEETKQKVMRAIEQLNYQPNMLARQFRRTETNIVLVIVPDLTNPFFSRVLRGIEHTAVQHGYQVIVGDTENNVERECEYLDLLRQKQADGVILLTARLDKDHLAELAIQYPVVLACEYIEGLTIPTVSIDNISSARKATEHLIKLGHKRIAHITGPLNIILSRDRMKGFQQAMINHELKLDPVFIQEGDFSYESGYNQMMKFLALENPPTAVFAANDEMAIGVVKAAKANGMKVPEDLAVVGFDNINMSSIFEPSITTVEQPKYKIGEKAMELLIKLINGEDLQKKQTVINDNLIIRNSCGANSSVINHN
jgi:LacI family transcriptional regulator, repressor for deo operon, udp, cdd, tsx, nupC, and nupG